MIQHAFDECGSDDRREDFRAGWKHIQVQADYGSSSCICLLLIDYPALQAVCEAVHWVFVTDML